MKHSLTVRFRGRLSWRGSRDGLLAPIEGVDDARVLDDPDELPTYRLDRRNVFCREPRLCELERRIVEQCASADDLEA